MCKIASKSGVSCQKLFGKKNSGEYVWTETTLFLFPAVRLPSPSSLLTCYASILSFFRGGQVKLATRVRKERWALHSRARGEKQDPRDPEDRPLFTPRKLAHFPDLKMSRGLKGCPEIPAGGGTWAHPGHRE